MTAAPEAYLATKYTDAARIAGSRDYHARCNKEVAIRGEGHAIQRRLSNVEGDLNRNGTIAVEATALPPRAAQSHGFDKLSSSTPAAERESSTDIVPVMPGSSP